MNLSSVAHVFDRMVCIDAYTGSAAFQAQLSNYDDTKRDSESAERRVISTHPDVVIPSRRVVQAAGTRFIIGHGNPDSYRGRNIRIGWVAHEATHLMHVRTLGQTCLDQIGLKAWAGLAWVKNSTNESENSSLVPRSNMHFAIAEPVYEGRIATAADGQMFIVRSAHEGPAGTRVCLVDHMPPGSLEVASLSPGTFDRVNETWTGSTNPVKVLRTRWQSLFSYTHSAAPKFGPGDIQVAIAKTSATPVVGQDIGMSDGSWKIESIADEGDAWLCRACRHA